jgi:cardiolipin synthase
MYEKTQLAAWEGTVRLLAQPGDSIAPIIKAIDSAKSRVEIVIFRFDRREIETALVNAVSRGVFVHALIAYTNRGGEKKLRELELRLLADGLTVSRTADDLVRYHYKFILIDRRVLLLLAFNFSYLDIERSRSFGLITTEKKVVAEAGKLFDADTKRQSYLPGHPGLVVSPENARKELSAFILGARKQLLIYDPEISDPAMIRLLDQRAKAGVEIRIIGRLVSKSAKMETRKQPRYRLHTRTIIRDEQRAFIGSQSLREMELERRRELGIIFRHPKLVKRLATIFEQDWELAGRTGRHDGADEKDEATPANKVAKKVAKAVARELPPLAPVVETVVKEMVGAKVDVPLNPEEVEETVKEAVKEAVREVVQNVVAEVAEHKALGGK